MRLYFWDHRHTTALRHLKENLGDPNTHPRNQCAQNFQMMPSSPRTGNPIHSPQLRRPLLYLRIVAKQPKPIGSQVKGKRQQKASTPRQRKAPKPNQHPSPKINQPAQTLENANLLRTPKFYPTSTLHGRWEINPNKQPRHKINQPTQTLKNTNLPNPLFHLTSIQS